MKFKLRKEDRTDAYGRRIDPNWDEGGEVNDDIRRHRKGYEEYFEGYAEKEELNRFGKKISVRVYVGDRFRPELSDVQRRLTKASYCVLLLLGIALNVGSLCLPVWTNTSVWTVIFGCIPTVFYFRYMLVLYNYVCAGPELKIYEYNKGAIPLTAMFRPLAVSAVVSVAAVPIVLLIFRQGFSPMELVRILMLAASPLPAFVIEKLEKKVKYTFIPGEKIK